jgi:TRAP-type C4-dicarboxylate transport system substrate-binding protein
VYRVDLPRTFSLVVALSSMVAPTSALVRDLPAADAPSEHVLTVLAPHHMGHPSDEGPPGHLQIRMSPSPRPGDTQIIEPTSVFAIDLSRTNVASIGTILPFVNMPSMPLRFRSVEHMHNVLDGPIGCEINSFKPCEFVVLCSDDSTARAISSEVRPVKSLTDQTRLSDRRQPSELRSDMLKALGTEQLQSPCAQVPAERAKRLIDGAPNNRPSFATADHRKYAPFHPFAEYAMSREVQMMPSKTGQSRRRRTVRSMLQRAVQTASKARKARILRKARAGRRNQPESQA